MGSIDIFPWNENFNTGLTKVDEQHEKLVRLLNRLAGHIAYQPNPLTLDQVFNELADYAAYHFATEEAIWHEFLPGDDMESEHLESHLGFIAAIERFKHEQPHRPLSVVMEDILSFLTLWLVSHILETDRHMAMIVQALQAGLSLDAAKQHVAACMSGTMRALTNVILSTYRNHVSNTLQLIKELSEREGLEQRQRRVARALKLLGKCNSLLLHSESEQELLTQICRIAVEVAGYHMAWVGYAQIDEAKSVLPFAVSGHEAGYLEGVTITWDDSEWGQGPTGASIRTGKTVVNQKFQDDQKMVYWKQAALERGYLASIALPLLVDKQVIGALTIYATESDSFNSEEVALLEELANDLAFGIRAHRVLVDHQMAQKKIDRLSHFDQLTGLPNRTQFNDLFKMSLRHAQRNGENLAVLFLDLDNFKSINDALGHSIGDQLLVEIGSRIKAVLLEDDTAARMGGDEFVLVLPNSDANRAALVAEKLLQAISLPFITGQHELSSTASIGVALYPLDGDTLEVLSKNADAAMYRAKQDGRNTFCFYTTSLQEKSSRNLQLLGALRHAKEKNEFLLHYQPQLSMEGVHGHRVVGAEALLRWKHPEWGMISPEEFIPIAESSGLIVQIGEWVLRAAVRQLKDWLTRGLQEMVMAVNLSTVQFRQSNIVELVTSVLNEAQLSPRFLELELTEAVAMDNPQKAIDVMNELHESGVRMSIDDFGTGYSSLSYLKQFKVYKLKIDKSFVRDIALNPEDKAIVNAIINLARSLGLKTIAEGVETAEQLAFLRQKGCDEVQGYYFSKPLPPEEFEAFVLKQTGKSPATTTHPWPQG